MDVSWADIGSGLGSTEKGRVRTIDRVSSKTIPLKIIAPHGRQNELHFRLQPMIQRTSLRSAFLLPNAIRAHRNLMMRHSNVPVARVS
jgi:hypothetical protein